MQENIDLSNGIEVDCFICGSTNNVKLNLFALIITALCVVISPEKCAQKISYATLNAQYIKVLKVKF